MAQLRQGLWAGRHRRKRARGERKVWAVPSCRLYKSGTRMSLQLRAASLANQLKR